MLLACTAGLQGTEGAIWMWSSARRRLVLRRVTRPSSEIFRLFGTVEVDATDRFPSLFGGSPVARFGLDSSTTPALLSILRVIKAEHAIALLVRPPTGEPLVISIGAQIPFADATVKLAGSLVAPLAMLYAGSRRLHREIEKNEVLTAINLATRAISSSLDEEQVYQTFADETRRLLKFERASLTVLDPDGERLIVHALNAELSSQIGPRRSIPIEGSGIGWVARNGLPLIREDLPKAQRFAEDHLMLAAGIRSSIYVPLIAHSRVLGTFNLSSVEPNAYTRDDLAILQPIADQLALAIENASIFGDRGRTLRELSAIQSVTDAALLDLDLPTILDTLTERVSQAIGADVGACFLLDPSGQRLQLRATYGAPPGPEPCAVRIGEGFAGRVAQSGTFLHVRDVELDPLVLEPYLRRRGLRTLLGVPLRAEERTVGVVCVAFGHVYRLQPPDVQLLQILADRMAAVLDHVQLREQIRGSRDELEALYLVSKLTAGSFNLEVILDDVLSVIRPVLPCASATLFTVDEQSESLTQAASYRFPRLDQPLSFARGEGLVGWVVKHNRGVVVEDCFEDPRFIPGEGIGEPCSVLIVPLVAGAKVVAALVLTRPRETPFTAAEVRVAQVVAGHAAQVIENAVLVQSVSDARLVRELDKAKTEFIGVASHELRTPLTAIKGVVETLLRPDLTLPEELRRELLEEIDVATTHLATIMDQLLDVSRIEAGRLETELVDLDLPALTERLIDRLRGLYLGRTVSLLSEPALPRVRADSALLEAVLQNLIVNALKYSPEDSPVTVEAGRWLPPGPEPGRPALVELRVGDRGPGIAPDDLPKLFRPFSRLRRGQASRVPGAGLGLYVARAFAEAMGGELGVTSELGVGSTFWLHLPACLRQAGDPQPQLPGEGARDGRARRGESGARAVSRIARGVVLVIDDEPVVLRTAEIHLSAAGYSVLLASTGEEGLALAQERRPDLILLDVLLPGLSGIEVARRLKQRPDTRQIPFVYLSAKTQLGERLDGLRVGADAYITKPFSPKALCEVVAGVLEQSKRERQRRRRAEVQRLAVGRGGSRG